MTQGEQDLIIITADGQALRFHEELVRVMGRPAAGVRGMKIGSNDYVASVCVVKPNADLLVVTTRGFGKRTPFDEFTPRGRNGKGVRCMGGRREQTGEIAAARVVHENDEVTFISANGMVLRTKVADLSRLGRTARGTTIMRLKPGDTVMSVAVLEADQE